MNKFAAFSIILALAATPALAQDREGTAGGGGHDAGGASRGAEPDGRSGDDDGRAPFQPTHVILQHTPQQNGAAQHSICPPGSSMHWEIVPAPGVGEAPGPSGYLLSCN